MRTVRLDRLLRTSRLKWRDMHGDLRKPLRLSAAGHYHVTAPECHGDRVVTLSDAGSQAGQPPALAVICGAVHPPCPNARVVVATRSDASSVCCALQVALAASRGQACEQHHGTLVRLRGRGVLISGAPGSGKSTLALALIREAGAALVADDCVDIWPLPERAVGNAPPLLQNFMHVPELGALDIARLFGQTRVVPACPVDLKIELTRATASRDLSGLHGQWQREKLAGVSLPVLRLAAGHSQAVSLVATAARMTGHAMAPRTMADTLQHRQQQAIRDRHT